MTRQEVINALESVIDKHDTMRSAESDLRDIIANVADGVTNDDGAPISYSAEIKYTPAPNMNTIELHDVQLAALRDIIHERIDARDNRLAKRIEPRAATSLMSDTHADIATLCALRFDMTRDNTPSTLAYVNRALDNGGYSNNRLSCANFIGMTSSGKEQHAIESPDDDANDGVCRGYVYVWERDGVIVGDF